MKRRYPHIETGGSWESGSVVAVIAVGVVIAWANHIWHLAVGSL